VANKSVATRCFFKELFATDFVATDLMPQGFKSWPLFQR